MSLLSKDQALYFDFNKSVGEKILPKEIIATCYAYLYLTGDRPAAHRGTWHQGKKKFEEKSAVQQGKFKAIADLLRRFARTGRVEIEGVPFECGDAYFIGKSTCDLEPINYYSGEGTGRFFFETKNGCATRKSWYK
jgi:hypothetical protein